MCVLSVTPNTSRIGESKGPKGHQCNQIENGRPYPILRSDDGQCVAPSSASYDTCRLMVAKGGSTPSRHRSMFPFRRLFIYFVLYFVLYSLFRFRPRAPPYSLSSSAAVGCLSVTSYRVFLFVCFNLVFSPRVPVFACLFVCCYFIFVIRELSSYSVRHVCNAASMDQKAAGARKANAFRCS